MNGVVDNLSYNELKELSYEEKKAILIQLKEKFASYKEMADKIGGTPLVLSNMYLRVVEGKRFGRNKKEKLIPAQSDNMETDIEDKVTYTLESNQASPVSQFNMEVSEPRHRKSPGRKPKIIDIQRQDTQPLQRAIFNNFTISLDMEVSGEEARSRMQGIIGALLQEKKYRINMSISESESET